MTQAELNAALDLTRKIERLKRQLCDLRESTGQAPDVRVQGSAGASTAEIVAELAGEVAELEQKLKIEQAIIQRYIDKLELDDLERRVMVLRNVECKRFRQIGKMLGYVERHIYRIHQAAITKSVDVS